MDFASQLKQSIDIVSVVGEYVRLQRSGQAYKGLCPFHQEKTPSFQVRTDRQFFYCFGCQKGGSVIDFVMEMDGLTFWEACKQLAERFHIPVPKRASLSDEDTRRRAALYEMHESAQSLFRAALQSPAGEGARAYLERRGVPQAMAEEFGLGLADRAGESLVRRLFQAGYAPEQIRESGLAVERQDGSGFFDFFRGRLMFPIHSETGKLIAFAGRALDDNDQPKYLNSRETEIYKKGQVLYNLHRARKPIRDLGHAILVEGYMDVIGLYAAGVREAVASCGTALKATQVRMIKRHTETIVVNFDPDKAGTAAAERSVDLLLEEDMRTRVLVLPGDLDPDEFVKAQGAETYRQLVGKAPNYFYWLADRARGKFDFRNAEGRVAGFRFLLPSIQRLGDRIQRAAIANDLAGYLGVDAGMILDQFRRMAADRKQETMTPPRREIPANERLLLRCLITSAEARQAVMPRLTAMNLDESLMTGGILKAVVKLGESFTHESLDARLETKERTLLAEVTFADEGGIDSQEEDTSAAQALACLARLETSQRETERLTVKERIREAERRGDVTEAFRLAEELSRLGRA